MTPTQQQTNGNDVGGHWLKNVDEAYETLEVVKAIAMEKGDRGRHSNTTQHGYCSY